MGPWQEGMKPEDVARNNVQKLTANPYPGRGIALGRLDEERLVQVYWIMGRSESSRNRWFVRENGCVRTEIVDTSIPADPLTLYEATLEDHAIFAVSNGAQTRAVLEAGGNLGVLNTWEFEPDEPNFTPRISGYCATNGSRRHVAGLSILRRGLGGSCVRHRYEYETLVPGFGYCVHTYAWDGKPIPSFAGDPILVPFAGDVGQVASAYWRMLNLDNRVSLLAKVIHEASGDAEIAIINRYGD